jgi:hypothetical protein
LSACDGATSTCGVARVAATGWHQAFVDGNGVGGLRVGVAGAGGGNDVGTIVACVDASWRPASGVRGQRVATSGVVIDGNAACGVVADDGIGFGWWLFVAPNGGIVRGVATVGVGSWPLLLHVLVGKELDVLLLGVLVQLLMLVGDRVLLLEFMGKGLHLVVLQLMLLLLL